jgi:glycosyltransferase involved in cell wall biosynthesis
LRRAAKNADRLIACSGAGRELFRSVGGDPARVEIVHNGLSPDFVKAAETTLPADLGEPGPHVGVFAAIETRKGQDVFLRAAEVVLQRYPDAVFWIVGRQPPGERQDFVHELSSLARQGRLNGRVRFTGHRSDVAGLMKAMDLMVLPSLFHESLPMSLIEAMSLGVPCVASRVGGTDEIIEDGRNGLLVTPGDVQGLAHAMCELLGPSGPEFGKGAAQDAARRFSGERFAAQVAAVYDDVQAERLARRRR